MRKIAILLFILGFLAPCANAAVAANCDRLRSITLDHATITAAAVVEAGAFTTRDAGPTPAGTFTSLPGFCRVQGVITPSADSDIHFEVWLPMRGWNGKYEGVGNGGLGGYINYVDMAAALSAGYATSSTDTGHKAPATNGQWGLGHPEKVTDYGYRAIHETAVKSKAIIEAFYVQGPRHSYFSSCSNGGRQALMEAQRFPEDYDGIIAGAPAAHLTRIAQLYVSNTFVTTIDPASYIPASKFAAVAAAAVAACDARDGVRDEIIDEPHKCTFDPSVLQCTGAESDSCLTALQVVALKKIYGGLRGGGGEQLYPGFLPGGEAGPRGWAQWIAGPSPTKSSQHIFGTQGNANLIFQNQAYDYRQFNADRDVKAADDLAGRVLNAIDADLRAFRQRGSKLIIYHGWSDAAIPPAATTEYYRNVAAKMGQKTVDGFLRLYMVPGMQHCGGGPGADSFGVLPSRGLARRDADPRRNLSTALERWVEHDSAPSAIISTKYKTGVDPRSGIAFTRLLCPYPQVAKYKGSGGSNEATNFVCKAPEK